MEDGKDLEFKLFQLARIIFLVTKFDFKLIQTNSSQQLTS